MTLKVNVISTTASVAGANLRCWMLALRMTSLATTSAQLDPSADDSRSPLDSTTVIVIEIRAESSPSTSVNGKSETA